MHTDHPPILTIHPRATPNYVDVNQLVMLTCIADGLPQPTACAMVQ